MKDMGKKREKEMWPQKKKKKQRFRQQKTNVKTML